MKTKETQVLDLNSIDAKMLVELQGYKEKQQKVVKDNPYIEITDRETYEEAKKRRTNLVKARTGYQGQEKVVKDKLNAIKNNVSAILNNEVISITKPFEEKQQAEVKRYEAIKEQEKAEKAEKERKRISNINEKILTYNNDLLKFIQALCFLSHKPIGGFELLVVKIREEFNFEEFDILFEEKVSERRKNLHSRIEYLKNQEDQRIETERLKNENEKLKKQKEAIQYAAKTKTELYDKRMKELQPYVAFIGDYDKYDKILKMSEVKYKKEVFVIKKEAEDQWIYEKKQTEKNKETERKLKALEDEKEEQRLEKQRLEHNKKVKEEAAKTRLEDEKRQIELKPFKEMAINKICAFSSSFESENIEVNDVLKGFNIWLDEGVVLFANKIKNL